MELFPKCPYQTSWLQSSPPLGPHFQSRQTPTKRKVLNTLVTSWWLLFIYVLDRECSGFFTWSQESRIITSSVARSSWVISPGTSSIWDEEKDLRCSIIYFVETVRTPCVLWIFQRNWDMYSGKASCCWLKESFSCLAYDEVSSLVGAGEESGWVSVHLVLESGRSAIFCLSSQSLPELICEEDGHTSGYYSVLSCQINISEVKGLKIYIYSHVLEPSLFTLHS